MSEAVNTVFSTLEQINGSDYQHARSMPVEFYTSPEFLEYEKEYLFRRQWACLGRVEELPTPGDYFTTELVGEPLLVVRTDDRSICVLSNVCRHRGMVVAYDRGNAKNFRCPYHHWTYNIEGKLLVAPLIEKRDDFDPKQCRLPEFRSEIWNGFIYVNLDGKAESLTPRLAGLDNEISCYKVDETAIVYCEEQVWPTNWKCLVENFMEGYHLSSVHLKTLHPVTPTRLCEHIPAGDAYMGYYSNFPSDLPQRGLYPPGLSDVQRQRSVMFSVLPSHVAGSGGHITTFICIQPEGVDHVRGKIGLAYYHADEVADEEKEKAIDLFQRTMAEDKEQLTNLQRGLKSRYYRPGPLAGKNYEGNIWDFYTFIARVFNSDQSVKRQQL